MYVELCSAAVAHAYRPEVLTRYHKMTYRDPHAGCNGGNLDDMVGLSEAIWAL